MKKKGLLLFPLIGGMMLGGCDLSNINILDLIDPLSIFHDKEIVPTKITLNFTSKEIQVGSSFSLTATVTPKDATNKKVSWSTSASNVAAVSSSGLVTAKAVGTATITAKTESGNLTAKCVVTVKEAEPEPTPDPIDKRGPEEFQGYKRVGKPDVNKDYVLGYYDASANTMKFATGNFHSDSKGKYPYYMETQTTGDGAAIFNVEYEDDKHFNIKVSCPGKDDWDGKYMAVYSAKSSFENSVASLAPVDNFTDLYEDTISPTHTSNKYKVHGSFEYIETFANGIYDTLGIYVADEIDNTDGVEQEPILRMLGCKYATYKSIDCSSIDKAMGDDYAVCHFFEKI